MPVGDRKLLQTVCPVSPLYLISDITNLLFTCDCNNVGQAATHEKQERERDEKEREKSGAVLELVMGE